MAILTSGEFVCTKSDIRTTIRSGQSDGTALARAREMLEEVETKLRESKIASEKVRPFKKSSDLLQLPKLEGEERAAREEIANLEEAIRQLHDEVRDDGNKLQDRNAHSKGWKFRSLTPWSRHDSRNFEVYFSFVCKSMNRRGWKRPNKS